MAVTGNIQARVNPPQDTKKAMNFNDKKVNDNSSVNNTDFEQLLGASSDRLQRQREALERGDLSSGSDKEFLEKLAEKTKQGPQAKNEMNKDDFLKLFVAQLQNQDPLNPDDGAAMASKLAQFNSLEQMMNMNTTLNSMVESQNVGRNLQLVGYVGKEVELSGGRISLKEGDAGDNHFKLSRATANTLLEIRDISGSVVVEKELGPMDSGEHTLDWDAKDAKGSKLPDGAYTFHISGRDIDGKKVPVEISSKTKITGVDIQSSEGSLYTDFGPVKFADILSVGENGYQKDTPKQETVPAAVVDEKQASEKSDPKVVAEKGIK